ncbi:MAG: HEAT repeat domain-containing protein [Gemmatimonadaceae bacterium]|nr:HEAT repeat domain-containing protein [Gemmatimonadaceae bacterium]
MNAAVIFGVMALVQALFLLFLFLFLLIRRRYDMARRAAFLAGQAELAVPLRNWIVSGAHPEPLVRALGHLPSGTAVGYLSLLARQTITASQKDELSLALRNERWMARAIAQWRSRFWWRRLESARALSLVGTPREQEALALLLRDEHPAVQVAAASALPRVADTAMLGRVVDGIFTLPKVVRQYVTTVLRQTGGRAGEALSTRIANGGRPSELAAWIELAAALDDATAITASLAHVRHEGDAVRRAVAKALTRHPGPDAARGLVGLLKDSDASVRALSARGLGHLGSPASVPALVPLLADEVWQVRLRAAVSLAQLGERGRAALRAAREGTDRFAREMATMVSGLSDGAVLELGDT